MKSLSGLTLLVITAAVGAAGCRTTGGSRLADVGGSSGCHASFVSPTGSGQTFDVWTDGASGGGLANVQVKWTPTDGATSNQEQVGTAPAVATAALPPAGSGYTGLRAYFKAEVHLDPRAYSCYDIGAGGSVPANAGTGKGAPLSFFCMGHGADPTGTVPMLWITNLGELQFVSDLVVYSSSCT